MVCDQHDTVKARLETGYKEKVSGVGLSATGGLVELYVSQKGTWTITTTSPDGVSCLMAAGHFWEFPGLVRFEAARAD